MARESVERPILGVNTPDAVVAIYVLCYRRAFGHPALGGAKMYCSQCGTQISAADTACLACGRLLPNTLDASTASTPRITYPAVADRFLHPYYGVGGWLSFFIFSIVFAAPAAHTWNVVRQYAHSMEIFAHSVHPYSLYSFYFVELVAGFAVYGYGMFAGIQLWRIRPNALKHAKQFLIVLLLYRFADYLMGINWLTLMLSDRARAIALPNFLVGKTSQTLLRSVIYAGVWYVYLLRSERVRVTYAESS